MQARHEGKRNGEGELAFSKMQMHKIWKRDKNVSGLMISASVLTTPLQYVCTCLCVCVCVCLAHYFILLRAFPPH